MSKRPEAKRDLSGPLSIVGLSLLFLVVVAVAIWLVLPAPKSVVAFGEAFGGIAGTLISGFALVFLIFTVLQQQRALSLQREELSLQREELRETREELKRTADAQVASEQALQEQVRIAQLAARLDAATVLLNHNQDVISGSSARGTPALIVQQARESRDEMLSELIRVRNELLGAVEGVGTATSGAGTASGTGEAGGPND